MNKLCFQLALDLAVFFSDLNDGKCVGCLIVGPDGEIIQLSLYADSQDQRHDAGGAEERGRPARRRLPGKCKELVEDSPCVSLSSPGCVCRGREVALGRRPAA